MNNMTDNNKGAKITLYWLNKSRSHRILWLLEELGLSYELKIFQRDSEMMAPPELKKIHPLGKSPVVTIETANSDKPLVLAESGAITEYLCDHFGGDKLVPKRYVEGKEGHIGAESEAWVRYRYFMHYCEGSLMPFLVFQLVVDTVKKAPGVPFFIKPIPRLVASKIESVFVSRNLFANFDFLEGQLRTAPNGGSFLCGKELTAADIMMSFPVIAASTRGPLNEKYPMLKAYADRLQQQEGYKRAVAKVEEVNGKFEASL
ncbi:hypothetical protein EYZ11_008324 [Aspergillus tanneri]|uniref:glutathione transferase n=1 Tax=Aspergillus tanneri TaxID=1220188 RepID=A0A4S3JCW2_9EURO|nr:uncharacterized protein ATNIH1004_000257 [Aspergillus tanneri]KAA8651375.1 hypothetical protein ATNIH1004_000257 [Aspergillus tanneri]THC92197.1 hypothetical protein EYZ11_008324 [Aspergillus tanneri]